MVTVRLRSPLYEAALYRGDEMPDALPPGLCSGAESRRDAGHCRLVGRHVHTPAGVVPASPGDWVVKVSPDAYDLYSPAAFETSFEVV